MSSNAESVLPKAKIQVKDGQQTNEPTKKKLLSLDAQRILSILENCISKVEIAAILDAVLRSSRLSSVVDKTLSRALQEHQMLAERLEMQEGLKQESGGGGKGEGKIATSVRVVAQLERDVKNSVRDLLRHVRDHPDAIFGLRAELGLEIGESECLLINELKKCHSHTSEKLQISVDEERELPRDKKTSSYHKLVSLEEEVTKAMIKVDKQISDKSHLIKTLQTSLQERKNKEAALSCVRDKLCQQTKVSKVKLTSTEQKIDGLTIQLNNLILENKKAVRELQKKNEKVESEIEYLLQNIEGKIEGIQANFELNEMEYKRVEQKLRNMQKSFSVLETECNQIQERHRLAEEKRKEEIRELELKTKAAILVQAWWRRYSSQRRKERGQRKDKKAKKGKGKKVK